MRIRPGRVTQLAPLRVQANGDTTDAPARAMSDFTGAVADPGNGTEVLLVTVDDVRYAWRVLA